MKFRVTNLGSLNLYTNPLDIRDGDLIHSVNVDSVPYGAKSKRSGYDTFLGTADGSAVTSLFSWTQNDGSLYVYRTSGTKLYYSTSGTGAWTLAGNGTISAGSAVGYAVLDDTLIIGDGAGSTRHTTNGTSFTDTTLAPVASGFTQYQNRIYAIGTSSTLFYSTTGDASNWNTSGTSDSSSITIPGEGKLKSIFKVNDRVVVTKSNGGIQRWDGFNLVDPGITLGPTSPQSLAQTEGYMMYLNRLGVFGYGGDRPELLSNAVESQVYNNDGNGIAGGTFDTAPGGIHRYDYYLAVGTVTDNTGYQLNNAILKYNFAKNEFLNYQFNDFPTALHSFKDANGDQQLIWGDSTGQCYQLSGTATTDNGSAIEARMEFVSHQGAPESEKEYRYFWGVFNPGCEAQISVAISNTYQNANKKWVDLGDAREGIVEYKFPLASRGRFLFIRIREMSKTAGFKFYGYTVEADILDRK